MAYSLPKGAVLMHPTLTSLNNWNNRCYSVFFSYEKGLQQIYMLRQSSVYAVT